MTTTPDRAPESAVQPSLGTGDPEAHPVQIRMLGPGKAEILLHDVDIANDVSGFYLSCPSATELPELVVMLHPKLATATEWEGFARVLVGEEPDPGPAAAKFLEAIDPDELERAALARLDLENTPGGGTAAMLRQLVEWANGRS
jgi:hypothetical protein